MKWIRVEESLPKMKHGITERLPILYSDDVLVFCSDGSITTGILGKYYDEPEGWSATEGSRLDNVTHWMPLPDAPEIAP